MSNVIWQWRQTNRAHPVLTGSHLVQCTWTYPGRLGYNALYPNLWGRHGYIVPTHNPQADQSEARNLWQTITVRMEGRFGYNVPLTSWVRFGYIILGRTPSIDGSHPVQFTGWTPSKWGGLDLFAPTVDIIREPNMSLSRLPSYHMSCCWLKVIEYWLFLL